MENYIKPNVYAVHHKNINVREESRSGGIFTAISDYVLNENGVIYGCVLNENFDAVHTRVTTSKERDAMRGSKYIQSDLGNTFKNIKLDLVKGRKVLFSGTSCQVAGLKKYLSKEYENLFCVDIVCHGVPSPKVWDEYIKWQEKKKKSKIKEVDFRNKKKYGWRAHTETLEFVNGKKIDSRVFTNLFYQHNILRPCCYRCPYKSIMHPGDITIADYWGIEKAAPEFDDNKGVSLVLVNNENGQKMFESISESIRYKSTKIEDSMQPPLEKPFPEPSERPMFWNEFQNNSFKYIAKKYGKESKLRDIKRFIINAKRKMVNKK